MVSGIDEILAEYGTRAGLGFIRKNDAGVCRLVFDGDLVVDVEAVDGEDDVHLVATVGQVPRTASPALLRDMLSANYMSYDTGGAALALSPDQDELVLCRRLPATCLTYLAFERSLDGLLAALEHWRGRLDDVDGEAAEAVPSPLDDVVIFRV